MVWPKMFQLNVRCWDDADISDKLTASGNVGKDGDVICNTANSPYFSYKEMLDTDRNDD